MIDFEDDKQQEEKRRKTRERVAKYRASIKLTINKKRNPKAQFRLDTYIPVDLMFNLENLAEYYEINKKQMIEKLIQEEFDKISNTYEYKEFLLNRDYRVTIDKKTGRTIRRNVKTGEILKL